MISPEEVRRIKMEVKDKLARWHCGGLQELGHRKEPHQLRLKDRVACQFPAGVGPDFVAGEQPEKVRLGSLDDRMPVVPALPLSNWDKPGPGKEKSGSQLQGRTGLALEERVVSQGSDETGPDLVTDKRLAKSLLGSLDGGLPVMPTPPSSNEAKPSHGKEKPSPQPLGCGASGRSGMREGLGCGEKSAWGEIGVGRIPEEPPRWGGVVGLPAEPKAGAPNKTNTESGLLMGTEVSDLGMAIARTIGVPWLGWQAEETTIEGPYCGEKRTGWIRGRGPERRGQQQRVDDVGEGLWQDCRDYDPPVNEVITDGMVAAVTIGVSEGTAAATVANEETSQRTAPSIISDKLSPCRLYPGVWSDRAEISPVTGLGGEGAGNREELEADPNISAVDDVRGQTFLWTAKNLGVPATASTDLGDGWGGWPKIRVASRKGTKRATGPRFHGASPENRTRVARMGILHDTPTPALTYIIMAREGSDRGREKKGGPCGIRRREQRRCSPWDRGR